jgi:hypothetical protein
MKKHTLTSMFSILELKYNTLKNDYLRSINELIRALKFSRTFEFIRCLVKEG